MSRLRLVGRLVARDLRSRPGQAVLMLLAITAATATLTLGLVLHGVTSQPYQQTRAATRGPDEVAYIGQPPVTDGPPGSAPRRSPGRSCRSRPRPRPGSWPGRRG